MIPSALILLGLLEPGSDSVLARTKQVAAKHADTSAARAQGFGPLQIGRIADLTPFQGQHWLHRWRVFSGSPDLASPSFVMFAPVDGVWRPAGLAYTRRMTRGAGLPDDLAGTKAPWHREIHLHRTALPGSADGVPDVEFDLRTIKGAFAGQFLPCQTAGRQRGPQ